MSRSLGLYISVPFCRMKCTYCNFASGVFPASDHDRYLERLRWELSAARERAAHCGWSLPETLGSIYLGGGTPSTLAPDQLRQIFQTIRAEFSERRGMEITIECAPGQISGAFLEAMVEVSGDDARRRASLGVQSLVDREAAATGRTHTRAIVEQDVRRLKEAAFAVNLDLIAGLPGQTRATWRQSLEALVALRPEHASLYMLEVDEDSRLGREIIGGGVRYGAGLVPSDDTVAAMYEEGCDRLVLAGLEQYEISNFAEAGHASFHNLRYWRREAYLGVGLDAHSMLRTEAGGAVRFSNTDDLRSYLDGSEEDGSIPSHRQEIQPAERLEEAWFLGLRMQEGVSLTELETEFGDAAIAAYRGILVDLAAAGLIASRGDRIALTARGRLLSNDVFESFLGVTPAEACLPV